MKQKYLHTLLAPLAALGFAMGAHADSLLRVACEGADVRAEVTINGLFKGECPIDVAVRPGTVKLRAVKKVDATRERVFEDEFSMGDSVIKRVEVNLSPPRLNAEGQRRENERMAAERAVAIRREQERQLARAAEERANLELREQLRKAVEAGDTAAMLVFADRYETGKGVPKNEAEARSWIKKAADAGNPIAAFRLTALYKTGSREDIADLEKILALPVEDERKPGIEGEDQVRAFAAMDPFFDVPGGHEKVSYRYDATYAGNASVRSDATCVRNGKYFDVVHKNQWSDGSSSGEATGALGGIIWLMSKSKMGLFKTNQHVITRIDRLSGHPFPLLPGKRFGITYTTQMNSDANLVSATTLTCGVIGDRTAIPRQSDGQGLPLMCLYQTDNFSKPMRMYWHESSGCFVMADGK